MENFVDNKFAIYVRYNVTLHFSSTNYQIRTYKELQNFFKDKTGINEESFSKIFACFKLKKPKRNEIL